MRDRQNALQHLVQIEGGKHRLTGIVQDRDPVHVRGYRNVKNRYARGA